MQRHTEITPLDIDAISKLVIHPIPCGWNGCTAIINSWFTLQRHLQQHCQLYAISSRSKGNTSMICQIGGCSDPEHQSLAMLKKHVNDDHLDTIPIACPALGCLYMITASQSCYSHFLAEHPKLVHMSHQNHLFKPQWSPLKCQLSSPPPLPLNSSFPSYKLISHISTIRSQDTTISKRLNSLTKSISSLEVSCDMSFKQQQQQKQNLMASSTIRHHLSDPEDVPKHIFSDILPVHIWWNTSFKTLHAQHSILPSDSHLQIDSILSAPPPWNFR